MGITGTRSGTITNQSNAGSLSASYLGAGTSTANASSFNYGNYNAGSAGLMIVLFTGRSDTARTVSSISIGGSNGTLYTLDTASTNDWCYIACRQVSSGNNNVTVTMSGTTGTTTSAVIGVWLLTGNTSDVPFAYASIHDTNTVLTPSLEFLPPYSVTFVASHNLGNVATTSVSGLTTADTTSTGTGTGQGSREYVLGRITNNAAAVLDNPVTLTAGSGVSVVVEGVWI